MCSDTGNKKDFPSVESICGGKFSLHSNKLMSVFFLSFKASSWKTSCVVIIERPGPYPNVDESYRRHVVAK